MFFLEEDGAMGRLKQAFLQEADRQRVPASSADGRGAATLAQMAGQGVAILCWCNHCGHNAELPADALTARLGGGMPVPKVGAHLRCRECGGKAVETRPAWRGIGEVTFHSDHP
jgi:hypothetical protein